MRVECVAAFVRKLCRTARFVGSRWLRIERAAVGCPLARAPARRTRSTARPPRAPPRRLPRDARRVAKSCGGGSGILTGTQEGTVPHRDKPARIPWTLREYKCA
eukprot:2134186-Prymnesium_polylepis.1